MSCDDEKIIKKDTLLFKLMLHQYDDEISRNESIDSKNSQMIAFLGIMLTIQLTLFVNVLYAYLSGDKWPLIIKVSSCVFLIFNLLLYIASINKFINAYAFSGEFKNGFNPTALFEKSKSKISEEKLLKNLLFNYSSIIRHNHDLIENNVKKANGGFKFLKLAGIVSVLFIVYILVLMVHFN